MSDKHFGRFLLRSNKSQNRKWHGRNSAGAVIKLPRHVYSRNSEASVSNDGKIPGFCKFLFLSSVINERSQNKDHNRPTLWGWPFVLCKVKIYSPRRVRRYLSPGNSIILEIAATLLFIGVTIFHWFGAHFVETQARFHLFSDWDCHTATL